MRFCVAALVFLCLSTAAAAARSPSFVAHATVFADFTASSSVDTAARTRDESSSTNCT